MKAPSIRVLSCVYSLVGSPGPRHSAPRRLRLFIRPVHLSAKRILIIQLRQPGAERKAARPHLIAFTK